jgi:hypothetical protein
MQNLRQAHHYPSQHIMQPPLKHKYDTLLRDWLVQWAEEHVNRKREFEAITSAIMVEFYFRGLHPVACID